MCPLTSNSVEMMRPDFVSTSPLKIYGPVHVQVDTKNASREQIHQSHAANKDTTLHVRDRILINNLCWWLWSITITINQKDHPRSERLPRETIFEGSQLHLQGLDRAHSKNTTDNQTTYPSDHDKPKRK